MERTFDSSFVKKSEPQHSVSFNFRMFVSALVGTTIILRAGRRSTVRSTKVGVVKPQNKTNHVIVMACGDNVGEVPLRVQSKKARKIHRGNQPERGSKASHSTLTVAGVE